MTFNEISSKDILYEYENKVFWEMAKSRPAHLLGLLVGLPETKWNKFSLSIVSPKISFWTFSKRKSDKLHLWVVMWVYYQLP